MKKLLALVLCVAMLVCCFAGCDNNGEKASSNNGGKTSSNDGKYSVGIVQLVQHDALDAATNGFKQALIDKLGEENVTFDYQVASGEKSQCTTIVSKFVSNKVDLIMANATDALAASAEATDSIPIVATSITDYATALGIKNWNGKTGFNVTGTSDLAPLDQQAAMIKELVPDAETVGILYCSGEANSKYQSDKVTAALKNLGITNVKEYTFVDTNDVTSVTQQAVDECDVIYIPTDNTAANNTEAINNVAEPAGVPIIAGEQGICKGCGIATLSIDYYDIGYRAGEMAAEILKDGKNPADMEIEYAEASSKQYMKDRAELLKVAIPDDYTAIEVK